MQRSKTLVFSLLLALTGLMLVAISPAVLRGMAGVRGFNWADLANVSQTYDAAGVILTALAFSGVVAALIVQIRDSRVNQENSARSFHLELIRLALDNESLRASIMAGTARTSDTETCRLLYANLWLTYWRTMFRLHYMTETELRLYLSRQHFHTLTGRRQWENSRDFYCAGAEDRRTRQFVRIVEEEYQRSQRAT